MNKNKLKNSFNICITVTVLVTATLLFPNQAIAARNLSQVTFNFPEIPKNGKLYLMIVKNETAYEEDSPNIADVVFQAVIEVKEKSFSINADGLPPGTYAAKFFLDTNYNGKLDTNAVGVPEEPYGFSNNKKGLFGPPDFEDITFFVKSGESTVQNAKFF